MVKMTERKESVSRILFKELLRSIKGNLKQFFSVIAISFLAVCLFSGLTSNAYNLRSRADELYRESNYADLYVTTTGLEEGDLEAVQGLNNVTSAEKRAQFVMTRDRRAVNVLICPDSNILSVPMMVQGEKGFVIADSYLTANFLNLGDTITLDCNNYLLTSYPDIGKQMETYGLLKGSENPLASSSVQISFTITGTMLHPEAVKTSKYMSTTVMYTDPDTMEKALFSFLDAYYDTSALSDLLYLKDKMNLQQEIASFVSRSYNQLLADSSDKEASIKAITDYFSVQKPQEGKKNNLVIAIKKESLSCYKGLQQDIDQALKLTFVFPVIFFLVSLLVILTTISQIIIRERMQIGSLKATGVKRSQIYLHYVSYGFFLTLIGTVLGFFIGPLFLPDVMNIKYKLLWDIPAAHARYFYPEYMPTSMMAIAMAVGLLLVAALVSFLVSYSVVKEKPVDTLRPKVPKYKAAKDRDKVLLAPFKAISSKLLSFKMAVRNMSRNKVKTTMVVLGTLGCTALLVCGFGVMDTLDNCLANDYELNMTRDILATPDVHSEKLFLEISQLSGVKRAEEVIVYPITLDYEDSSSDTYATLMEEDSLCFHVPYGVDGGVTIDKTTAEHLGCGVGDQVKAVINGSVYERKVTYIFTSSSQHGIYDLSSDFSEAKLTVNNYWITCQDSKDASEVKAAIKDQYGSSFSADSSLMTQDEYFAFADELLSAVRIMTRVVEIFAILLAAVVTYNLTSLNIAERTRDIATMKVLGFRTLEINRTLIEEIMFDTLIGTSIGLFFGLPMCELVMMVNQNEFITYLYHITALTYVIAILVSLGSAFLVNLLLTSRTKKVKMVESLKSVE
jgi:putative ABC transport system permease protein